MLVWICVLMFYFGLCSFFTYRLGIKEGVKLCKDIEDITICDEDKEKDFSEQYHKMMNYDFDIEEAMENDFKE